MKSSFIYQGYRIDVFETKTDYRYNIKDKNEKLIIESAIGFPFPYDAELQAKLYIDRIIKNKDGWIIT